MGLYHVVLNGEIRPSEDAAVSLFSPALFDSFGVYESVEVVQGTAFYLEEHLWRMLESARLIELDLPYSVVEIAGWVDRLIEQNGNQDCMLRIVALGVTQPGEEVLVALLPQPPRRYAQRFYDEGAPVITYEGCRSLPVCKSLNTLVNYLARREAVRRGVLEAILFSRGEMTEGARSNIFAVNQDCLLTPPTDRALSGITRDIVIRIAGEAGYRVVETPLYLADVVNYSEFFVTSTSMHIVPVVKFDGSLVGDGRIGRVTADLSRRFERYHVQYLANRRSEQKNDI